METKELEKKLEDIKGRITANLKNTEEAEKRNTAATKRLEEYQARYEKARGDRQSLLASGKDVKKINESIKTMQADKELAEDETIGLDKMLVDLNDEANALEKKERETEIDILKSKLLPLVPAYNEAAAQLAAVVENIWELLYVLDVPNRTRSPIASAVGWDENAFAIIPRLFEAVDQIPTANSEEAVHFSWRIFIDKKRRAREAAAEAAEEERRGKKESGLPSAV